MNEDVAIRGERDADPPVIDDLVRRAYADVRHSDRREHLMVARLRETPSFMPALSLVAEREGVAVGHVLLVEVGLAEMAAAPRLLALAPLSVVPAHRGRGVGRALVRAAHERALQLGFAAVVVIGMPGYYGRLGYEPLGDTGLALPSSAHGAQFMVRRLVPEALVGVRGVLVYPPAWFSH